MSIITVEVIMNKINGYTEEEAKELVSYISEGKKEGKTLSYLFAAFGKTHGRARGSVRNYYYGLLKMSEKEEIRALLEGTELKAGQIREFTEEETDRILRAILTEKSKGVSVRRAIFRLAEGDDKLMLRYQNKYRNILKKQPERIASLSAEMGIQDDKIRRAQQLQARVEEEINALYSRISQSLREENTRLKERIAQLEAENSMLKK